jgi:hypothetical protein
VIKGMDRDKAPGPNGFSLAFSRIVGKWLKGTLWRFSPTSTLKVNW